MDNEEALEADPFRSGVLDALLMRSYAAIKRSQTTAYGLVDGASQPDAVEFAGQFYKC